MAKGRFQRRHTNIFGAGLAVLLAGCAHPKADLAIVGAVIHSDAETPPFIGDVYVQDGKIVRVQRSGGGRPWRARETFDGAGMHATPGLWDAHTHVRTGATDGLALSAFLYSGITSVRDLGGVGPKIDEAKAAVAAGSPGPEIYASYEALNGVAFGPHQRAVRNYAEAVAAVDDLASAGAAVIKVHRALPPQLLSVVVTRAHLRGLPVTGHIPIGLTPLEACEAGMDGVEHIGSFIEAWVGAHPDTSVDDAITYMLGDASAPLYDCLKARKVFVTPTLVVYHAVAAQRGVAGTDAANRFIANMARIAKRLSDNRVPLLVGTDTSDLAALPIVPGVSVIEEMLLLERAGISPAAVMAAATVNAARAVGAEGTVGALRPGHRADIVVLREDPAADVSAYRGLVVAYVRGRRVVP